MPKKIRRLAYRNIRRHRGVMRRGYSPRRQYGGDDDPPQPQSWYHTAGGILGKARRGSEWAYRNVLSPTISAIGRAPGVAGDLLRSSVGKARRGTAWTYRNVLTPTARTIGRVSPGVARAIRDYALSPVYEGIKYISPKIGSAVGKYIVDPLWSGAQKYHEHMMQKPYNSDKWYCVDPYIEGGKGYRTGSACRLGGPPDPRFENVQWAKYNVCENECKVSKTGAAPALDIPKESHHHHHKGQKKHTRGS
jgi:hypothetical protein